MASPLKTPHHLRSASPDYRTPEIREKQEKIPDSSTTRTYFLRETECRLLTLTGASPYRVPGRTTSKKKSRRTPLQPKVIEENVKQIAEENILDKNLAKALFIDNEKDVELSEGKITGIQIEVNNCDGDCDKKTSETEDKENTKIISEQSPEKLVVTRFESTDAEEPRASTDEEEAEESSEEYEQAKELAEEQKEVAVSVEERREAGESSEEFKELVSMSSDEKSVMITNVPNRKPTNSHWTPTKPVSPKLTACKRKRTCCTLLTCDSENIAQSIKKNTFKATPFNKKTYLSTLDVGVKRVDPKPITKPDPFYFHCEERIRARHSKFFANLFSKLSTEAQTSRLSILQKKNISAD